MVLAKRGDLPGALKALEQALELQPGDEATLVYRGNVYLLMNDAARALADYQAALKINPEDQAALQGRMSAERALSGAQ
jgi:tetratricopeptide (TPR) repeat protein